jgi:hypothetical protein
MKMFRLVVRTLAVALVVAAAAYAGYWFLTANRLRTGLEQWAVARRAQGYSISWRQDTIDGFPWSFRIRLTDAAIARGNDYRVTVPAVTGIASPLDLRRWHIAAPLGGSGTAQGIDATIAARSLTGDVTLGETVSSVAVSILQLTGAGASAGEVTAQITLPRRPPRSHREVGLDASLGIFHLTLPRPVTALGDTIEHCGFDLSVLGALPTGDWRQALAAWRDDGGTVELERSDLEWGALRLEANGTFALDRAMQPIASLSASIVNHAALVNAAVAAGMLPKRNATVVKLVLDLLAHRGPDGQSRLTAPVTLQDGKVSIGRAEIARVPPIQWQ